MKRLLNLEVIESRLTRDAAWCKSHGADGSYLGAGLLYYAIVHMLRAEICVCVGSGGGFVPRMMRQAQLDLGLEGETHLVDANLPEAGWGGPQWMEEDSFFRVQFPDIQIHILDSQRAAATVLRRREIDYVHIDGDHSFDGCMSDIWTYTPLLSSRGLITLHDTVHHRDNPRCKVNRVVEMLQHEGSFQLVDFPFVGSGVAVLRPWNTQGAEK